MPPSLAPNPAAETATSPTTPGRSSATRRAWRLARPFLVLAAELAVYTLYLYVIGALVIYFALLRAGDVFQRIEGEVILAGLGALALRLALLMLVGEYLAIICHELGHVLAARLMGYRFGWLRVEGFVVRRTPRGPRLGVSDGALLGGTTHCLPYHSTAMRSRHVVFVLGGALVSLVVGLVALLVSTRWFADSLDPRVNPLGTGLLFFALINLFGVLNLIPMRTLRSANDGLLIVRTIRDGPAVTHMLAMSGLRGCVERRERPRAWPGSLVERALVLAELAPGDPLPYLFAYSWALDRGEHARAGTYLDAVLARPFESAPVDATIALEAAYYLARYRGDGAGARAWLDRGDAAAYAALLRPRAEAALALLEDRFTEAQTWAEAGLAEVARLASVPESFNVEEGAESLRELVALAHAARAPSSP
jgi:hypothetical protein